MVICEAADQKMYWLITLVLAAKLVIDGWDLFTSECLAFSLHFRHLRTTPIDFPCGKVS